MENTVSLNLPSNYQNKTGTIYLIGCRNVDLNPQTLFGRNSEHFRVIGKKKTQKRLTKNLNLNEGRVRALRLSAASGALGRSFLAEGSVGNWGYKQVFNVHNVK